MSFGTSRYTLVLNNNLNKIYKQVSVHLKTTVKKTYHNNTIILCWLIYHFTVANKWIIYAKQHAHIVLQTFELVGIWIG